MRAMTAIQPSRPAAGGRLAALAAGFHASLLTVLLLAAINTGIAAVLWIGDPRPFWHPFVTVQLVGFAIAYCVNVACPWDKSRPILRLAVAVCIGSLIGLALTIIVKGYTLEDLMARPEFFAMNVLTAFLNGLFVSLFFYVKHREARAAAALHKAEAERHLMSKHALEAELKLMQAQVEPHFLFNTLASVQYLTETDPREAGRLLSHLIDYLRAALPQLRASSTTLGKEVNLAAAYLNILQMRMGSRLAFHIDVPDDLAAHPFPPNLLISLVENAIKHGVEPAAEGGTIDVTAHRDGDEIAIDVVDTGRGAATPGHVGSGVGLSNVRERLSALYGERGRFVQVDEVPRGTRATLAIPFEAHP
jgi:sensor histidine kinase YesM